MKCQLTLSWEVRSLGGLLGYVHWLSQTSSCCQFEAVTPEKGGAGLIGPARYIGQMGFVQVLEILESPGISENHFPGLESPGILMQVLESPGNLKLATSF